jgi:hypothetical protein
LWEVGAGVVECPPLLSDVWAGVRVVLIV